MSVIPVIFCGCSAPAAPVTPQQPVEMVPRLGVNALSLQVQFKEGDSKTVTRNITFMNEGEGVMVWAVRKTQPWIWMNEMDGALDNLRLTQTQRLKSPRNLDMLSRACSVPEIKKEIALIATFAVGRSYSCVAEE